MKNRCYVLIFILFFMMVFSLNSFPKNDLCPHESGYAIGFFNGVWNTRENANYSLSKISEKFGTKYNGENIRYELFYNQSGLNGRNSTLLEDLAEVFIQRSQELDGEILKNRWEIFWHLISESSSDKSFLDNISLSVSKPVDAIKKTLGLLFNDFIRKAAEVISSNVSNPPVYEDYASHQTRLKTLILEKEKILLIAHSQGNLFVNRAYDSSIGITSSESLKVVHVAPASPTVRGNYELADLDLVINALRAVGGSGSVPDSNIKIPFSHLTTDASGHKFFETYLNNTLPTSKEFIFLAKKALDDLKDPPTQGEIGFFTVTLTWDGLGDVDLHVMEPEGKHVYFSQRNGNSGYLDYDNTHGFGPEHYYLRCDSSTVTPGLYQVGIRNFAGANGRRATIQVATNDNGEIFSSNVIVGDTDGSSPPENIIVKIKVSNNNNKWLVSIL